MTATATTASWIAALAGDPRVRMLRDAREADVVPYFRPVGSTVAPVVEMEGRRRIMLGSANYLGLADHPAVKDGARRAIGDYGTTVTGSRLLNGTTPLHRELEAELADWLGTEAALVFTTGYQANVGTIASLVGAGDTAIVDSADHASIVDGCVLSRAKVRSFRHNRLDLLDEALEHAAADGGKTLVVVDGLFSMGGDVPPLAAIVERCERAGAALMVDEAHACGVLGERGAGACELMGVEARTHVRMGALSKALGATGGFIAGSRDLVDYLSVSSRAFLFSTAAVPATLGAALAAIRLRRSEEGRERAARVLEMARYLWRGLRELGLPTCEESPLPDRDEGVVSPIVPVVVGDDGAALSLWCELYEKGVFTSVALFPAVPRSSALLRLCVMATHTREQMDRTLDAFVTATAASGWRPAR